MNILKKYNLKKIFLFCIFFSLIIHLGGLIYLHRHLLSFSLMSKYFTPQEKEHNKISVDKLKEEDIVVFAFEREKSDINNQSLRKKILLEKEDRAFFKKQLIDRDEKATSYSYDTKLKDLKNELIEESIPSIEKNYKIDKQTRSNEIVSILKEIVPKVKKLEEKAFASHKFYKEKVHFQAYFNVQKRLETQLNVIGHKQKTPFIVSIDRANHIEKTLKEWKQKAETKTETIASPFLPFLPKIPTLQELNTISCPDDFDIDVEYIDKENGGYLFALTLIPKPNQFFKKIKQNYYFVIDRSNSIQHKRFVATKQAVVSALSYLNPEDTFNIMVFDSSSKTLFQAPQKATHENISYAKAFLLDTNLASFFSSKSLIVPFKDLIENKKDVNEINNIIFMSDGEGFNSHKNCRLIKSWTEANKGKQNLYCLAYSKDKNLSEMDLFASLNKGKLITSNTFRGFRRHLVRLIKTLNYPIAKNVSISIYDHKKDLEVQLYPSHRKFNHLYLDDVFVIIGSCEKLDDFTVFVQGKNPEKWFNIKKDISFFNANPGGKSLSERWALYRANQCYGRYLNDFDIDHLKKAEEILKPYNLAPAFR